MRRIQLTLATTIILVLAAAIYSTATATAASSCGILTPSVTSGGANFIGTFWEAQCNTTYNLDVVLQYQDVSGVWHTATCQNNVPCTRNKPNNGGWFGAREHHTGNDTWNPITPANPCQKWFRLRANVHFQDAGGVTVNGNPVKNTTC